MNDETNNIVAFEPRHHEPPALAYVEMRLDATCGIEMTLRNDDDSIAAVISYSLASRPEDFDLNLLRDFWDRHRGGTAAAS